MSILSWVFKKYSNLLYIKNKTNGLDCMVLIYCVIMEISGKKISRLGITDIR